MSLRSLGSLAFAVGSIACGSSPVDLATSDARLERTLGLVVSESMSRRFLSSAFVKFLKEKEYDGKLYREDDRRRDAEREDL